MARNSRFTLPVIDSSDDDQPRSFSKQEFGRRLRRILLEKRWNQSELARRAQLGRDAVSVYCNGHSFPDPKNLEKLAKAVGMKPHELLPNALERAIDAEQPALSIRQAAGFPDKVWVRVNQMMTLEQAVRIAEILKETSSK